MEPNIFVKNVQFLGKQGDNRAAIQIDYIYRIINNNRTNVTEEEICNPVIFDKQCKNFVELEISIIDSRDSAKWLSGGNFDFKTNNNGSGYHVQVRYSDYDGLMKGVIAILRGIGLVCFPGNKSTTCFLAGKEPRIAEQSKILDDISMTLTSKLKELVK